MGLRLVTFTGADDRTNISEMMKVSNSSDLVEWGILCSMTRHKEPRFPSRFWIERLRGHAEHSWDLYGKKPKLSLHVCGIWVEQLLRGFEGDTTRALTEMHRGLFHRVQLNFAGLQIKFNEKAFAAALVRVFGRSPIIFQIDGAGGESYARAAEKLAGEYSVSWLFDHSHGKGRTPTKWPSYVNGQDELIGYAGGLNPWNIEEELVRINAAAGGAPFWVDMETGLRHEGGEFSLSKCRIILTKCESHAEGEETVDA